MKYEVFEWKNVCLFIQHLHNIKAFLKHFHKTVNREDNKLSLIAVTVNVLYKQRLEKNEIC